MDVSNSSPSSELLTLLLAVIMNYYYFLRYLKRTCAKLCWIEIRTNATFLTSNNPDISKISNVSTDTIVKEIIKII